MQLQWRADQSKCFLINTRCALGYGTHYLLWFLGSSSISLWTFLRRPVGTIIMICKIHSCGGELSSPSVLQFFCFNKSGIPGWFFFYEFCSMLKFSFICSCGGKLISPSGSITSPGYPQPYHHQVKAAFTEKITLQDYFMPSSFFTLSRTTIK